jgi:hypothetical protein
MLESPSMLLRGGSEEVDGGVVSLVSHVWVASEEADDLYRI